MDITGHLNLKDPSPNDVIKNIKDQIWLGKLSWSYSLATRMGEQHFKGSKRFLFFVWLVDLLQFCGDQVLLFTPPDLERTGNKKNEWDCRKSGQDLPKLKFPKREGPLCVNSKEQRLQLGHGFGIPLSVELNMYVWFIHNYNLIMCYSKAILVHVIFRNFTF